MKEPHRGSARHRVGALVLAAATLWTAAATAGSDSAASALSSLREAAKMQGERWEAAFAWTSRSDKAVSLRGELSPAALLALSQSPLLYSLRDDASQPAPETNDESSAGTATGESGFPEQTGSPDETGSPEEIESPQKRDSQLSEYDESKTPGQSGSGTPDRDTSKGPQPDGNPGENAAPADPNATESVPLRETPVAVPEAEDNGVAARTLIPTDPSGYTVCGRVYISSSRGDTLSVSALQEPFDAELTGDAPQILILHSHGSEAYTPVSGTDIVWSGDSRTTDFRYSVVRVGDEMASVFQEAGITVLHDRTLYDYPNYTGSYDRSLAAINSYLSQYPSIRFILDVHRDYIADSKGRPYKVISEIEGVGKAAQLTLVMGSDGSGATHPRWMENLKLAVAVQEQVLSEYPTLMRPLLLRKSRYNQHATTGSMLIEVGAAGNAPEEAVLAARLFAEQMVVVLQGRSK